MAVGGGTNGAAAEHEPAVILTATKYLAMPVQRVSTSTLAAFVAITCQCETAQSCSLSDHALRRAPYASRMSGHQPPHNIDDSARGARVEQSRAISARIEHQ